MVLFDINRPCRIPNFVQQTRNTIKLHILPVHGKSLEARRRRLRNANPATEPHNNCHDLIHCEWPGLRLVGSFRYPSNSAIV